MDSRMPAPERRGLAFGRKIKKIIFDFDGVLVDSLEHNIKEVQRMAEVFGFGKLERKEIIKHWGIIFEKFLEALMPGVTVEMYIQKRVELGLHKNVPKHFEGARRTLRKLSKKYPLSLISNRERITLGELMAGNGIKKEWFQYIQTASDTEFHKPDPRVFEKVLAILEKDGISKEEILYVGDHSVDFEASKGAGLNFVGILSGHLVTREEFIRAGVLPERVLDSVRDLPNFLLTH